MTRRSRRSVEAPICSGGGSLGNVLALVLALAFAVAVGVFAVPGSARAEEFKVDTYDGLKAAIDQASGDASSPDVITITNNIVAQGQIEIPEGKHVVLQSSNGSTITRGFGDSAQNLNRGLIYLNGGDLTVRNITLSGEGQTSSAFELVNGSLVIGESGGSDDATHIESFSLGVLDCFIRTGEGPQSGSVSVTIESGTIINNDNASGGSLFNGRSAIEATLAIKGGLIGGYRAANTGACLINTQEAAVTIDISGGTISYNDGSGAEGSTGTITLKLGSCLTMTGGMLSNNSCGGRSGGISIHAGAEATITGGSLLRNTRTYGGTADLQRQGGNIYAQGALNIGESPTFTSKIPANGSGIGIESGDCLCLISALGSDVIIDDAYSGALSFDAPVARGGGRILFDAGGCEPSVR